MKGKAMTTVLKMTKEDDLEKLTVKQQRAIVSVLSSRTLEEALRTARISRNQWFVWFRKPFFRAEFDKRKTALFDEAISRLRGSMTKAVEALEELCEKNIMVNPPTRLKAAIAIIEIVSKADVESDLQRRIEALEQAQIERKRQ